MLPQVIINTIYPHIHQIHLKNPIACDPRNRPYKNGKTFEDCKLEARKVSQILSEEILSLGGVSWNRVLDSADHDEIVYKLTLKYLREMGYEIGNYTNPKVTTKSGNINSKNTKIN